MRADKKNKVLPVHLRIGKHPRKLRGVHFLAGRIEIDLPRRRMPCAYVKFRRINLPHLTRTKLRGPSNEVLRDRVRVRILRAADVVDEDLQRFPFGIGYAKLPAPGSKGPAGNVFCHASAFAIIFFTTAGFAAARFVFSYGSRGMSYNSTRD